LQHPGGAPVRALPGSFVQDGSHPDLQKEPLMKHPALTTLLAAACGLGALAALPAHAADVDVGVSIRVGQPGFYGQIDIGNMRPPVVYAQPMMIERTTVRVAPVYLRVPPGHEKNWAKHCHAYQACGRPVYFVKGDWYEREYVPVYRDRYDNDRGRWRDDDDGPGRSKGKGHDHGKGHGHGRD
jgi:hypothetical protein